MHTIYSAMTFVYKSQLMETAERDDEREEQKF